VIVAKSSRRSYLMTLKPCGARSRIHAVGAASAWGGSIHEGIVWATLAAVALKAHRSALVIPELAQGRTS
jgi:hypothetical protein